MAANPNRPRVFKFNVKGAMDRGRRATGKAMDIVAAEMTAEIQRKTNKPYPPASTPGNFPHKRTGNFQSSTQVVRVGKKLVVRTTNVGRWLELGTSRMSARPWAHRVVSNKKWTRRLNDLSKKFLRAEKK